MSVGNIWSMREAAVGLMAIVVSVAVMMARSVVYSRSQHDKRLSFLDDVGREFRTFFAAQVGHRVDGSRGDEKGIAGFENYGRPAVQPIFQLAFNDIGDFFPGMAVPGEGRSSGEVHQHLDHFAS